MPIVARRLWDLLCYRHGPVPVWLDWPCLFSLWLDGAGRFAVIPFSVRCFDPAQPARLEGGRAKHALALVYGSLVTGKEMDANLSILVSRSHW